MELKENLDTATLSTTTAGKLSPSQQVGMVSIVASVISTLLIRIAARTSFVILSFYIGKETESVALVVVVIEAFYISELLLAPIVGSLSDRHGRKRYMMYAPIAGAFASGVLLAAAFLFPQPKIGDVNFQFEFIAMMVIILTGRLLEGTAAALNAPSNLGYLTDVSVGNDKLRARIMTAYEVATVAGIAMAIPFGGQVWNLLGRAGFLVAIAIYGLCFLVIALFMKESLERSNTSHKITFKEYREILANKRIFTFVPGWLAIMALIGAWLTLILIVLAYPTGTCRINPANATANIQPAVQAFTAEYCFIPPGELDADKRFPNQLLDGGFLPTEASSLVGLFGFIFIIGMGLWTIILPRVRRTTVMLIGMAGLLAGICLMFYINSLGNNPIGLSEGVQGQLFFLLPLLAVAVLILSGFTPAALTHLASISETIPGKRGAVMGLYSVLLGIGQLGGVFIGGLFVDWLGFHGLMVYSIILGLIAFGSVMYMRSHGHDQDDHLYASSGH